ncbi:MAG: hypothetical protein U0Q16_35695 [Bryobacteraceae bacterium]
MDRVFYFTSNAVGVACRIRRPNDLTLESQAPSCLSPIAGVSSSTAGPATFDNGLLVFGRATTSCTGDYTDLAKAVQYTHGNHTLNDVPTRSTTTCDVSGLAFTNTGPTTSRRLATVRNGFQLIAENANDLVVPQSEPLFKFQSLTLEEVTIDEATLLVSFDPKWFQPHTYTGLGYKGSSTFTSVVKSVAWADPAKAPPDVKIDPNEPYKIVVPDFGTIYLGELLLTPLSHRITMVRVALGSPDGGDGMSGTGDTNGTSFP